MNDPVFLCVVDDADGGQLAIVSDAETNTPDSRCWFTDTPDHLQMCGWYTLTPHEKEPD